jgi:hypothetical protein
VSDHPDTDRILERWRRPAVTFDAVEGETLVQMPSGEVMVNAAISVDEETLERMFEGRICKNCLEPLEVPFPEICNALKLPDGQVVGCYYRVKANQLRDLHMEYGSLEEARIGPRVKKSEEIERLREMDEFENRTGIILPPSVKFPTETIVEKRR